MATYKTAEVAAMIGVHPNTVRLYEKMKLIPKPERLSNGYRVFTDFHIWQCKLIRKILFLFAIDLSYPFQMRKQMQNFF